MLQPRLVEVRQKLLTKNDALARSLRERYQDSGVVVISLVSSPGSGKTAFLEKILTVLHRDFRVAALTGDLATENDARRLAAQRRSGAADFYRNGVPSGRLDGRCSAGRLESE